MSMVTDVRILVVDDNTTFRKLLRQILGSLGFSNTIEADDGETALSLLEKEPIGLVFTDWNMHRMSGLELVTKIRSHSKLDKIKIIMVTVNNTKEEVLAAINAGANSYIIKPFDRNIVLKTIYRVLSS